MDQKITPTLWFNTNAKEAADYYVAAFPDSKILAISYYPETEEQGLADFQLTMAGKELTVQFVLNGQTFMALNGGPKFTFNEAVSFSIECQDQEEIDYYWSRLSKVPEAEQCGWCKDQFGLSWQVVPANLGTLMKRPEAYAHMMQMKKFIISDL